MVRARPARWPMFLVMAVLAGTGLWALVARTGSGTDPDLVEGAPAGVSRSVESYRITYRVEGFTADGAVLVDTERRWVRLPFESRVEVFTGDSGSGELTFLQVAAFGLLQTGRPGEAETAVLTVEPGPAPGDARVTAVANDGLLQWRGRRRTVAGRRCEVHRASGPVDIDRADPLVQESGGFADLCVDDAGIVLHEEWYVDGRLFRRRTAERVEEGGFAAGDLFTPSAAPIGAREGGGGLVELVAGSRPDGVAFYELHEPPRGFVHRGRYAYTPPRAGERSTVVHVPRVAAVMDVWVRGPDVLVVENGGTVDNADPFAPPPAAAAVDAGALGEGEVLAGVRSAEVRVLLDAGRYVRVRGTLAASALLELTRSLVEAVGPAPGVVAADPPPSTIVPAREPGTVPAVICTRDDDGRLECRQDG